MREDAEDSFTAPKLSSTDLPLPLLFGWIHGYIPSYIAFHKHIGLPAGARANNSIDNHPDEKLKHSNRELDDDDEEMNSLLSGRSSGA